MYKPNIFGAKEEEKLKKDIKAKCCFNKNWITYFDGVYPFGAFHSGHKTGGLGRFTLIADVTVTCKGTKEWSLIGTATMPPDDWDFDWKWKALVKEQKLKYKRKINILKGRETRTALGSFIPGKKFAITLKGNVKIEQNNNDQFAKFKP